jgi:hypothetical protein
MDSGPAMASRYLRTDFVPDLLGFLPADWLLLAAATLAGHSGEVASGGALWWLPMLRLLQLARLYRVR